MKASVLEMPPFAMVPAPAVRFGLPLSCSVFTAEKYRQARETSSPFHGVDQVVRRVLLRWTRQAARIQNPIQSDA
jgi:hypothetical protein